MLTSMNSEKGEHVSELLRGRLRNLRQSKLFDGRNETSPIAWSILGSAVVRAASLFLEFVLAIALARLLGADGYGIYIFAFSVMRVLAIPAQAGMPSLVVRETATYLARGDWRRLRGLLRFVNRTVLVFSVVIGGIAICVDRLVQSQIPQETRVTLAVALLLLPLVALGNIRGATLRGLQKVLQGQLPENVLRPGLFLVLLISAWCLDLPIKPRWAMFLHWLAAAIAFLCGVLMLRSLLPKSVSKAQPVYEAKYWLISAFPLSASMGMMVVNNQASVLALGLLDASTAVGVYGAAAQVSLAATMPLTVINLALGPFIAKHNAIGEMERIEKLTRACAWLLALTGIAAVTTVVVIGDWILGVAFGPEFVTARTALIVLTVGYSLGSLSGISMLLLNMTRGEKAVAWSFGLAVALNILLNLCLIPSFGLNGAAVATAVGMVVLNLMLVKGVILHLGFNPTLFTFRWPSWRG